MNSFQTDLFCPPSCTNTLESYLKKLLTLNVGWQFTLGYYLGYYIIIMELNVPHWEFYMYVHVCVCVNLYT